MAPPKLSKLELKILEALWTKGPSSVREIQETFPAKRRPAYTTAQRNLIDELLGLFGGRVQPLMSHLIESGQLTLDDIEKARAALRSSTEKE
jgi:BlaI family penicillinase repressor